VVKFVGREAELQTLHQMLQQNNQIAIAAIAGMGGLGKTLGVVECR
jgi:tRNA A22 N-methylase